MASTNGNHPAVVLERKNHAAAAILRCLPEGHDAFPIGRGVVGNKKYRCGIAEIDANRGLLGQWSADRLQQTEGRGAASRGIDDEVRRNCLAGTVAILETHGSDRLIGWRPQHFLHPASLT